MNRKMGSSWFVFVFIFSLISGVVTADDTKKSEHDIPFPFLETNRRVELADGEQYTLIGKVVYYDEQAYLEVDLSRHPWLKSTKRSKVPYYPLHPIRGSWRKYQGHLVQLQVAAHGLVMTGYSYPQYVIWLNPVLEPLVLR